MSEPSIPSALFGFSSFLVLAFFGGGIILWLTWSLTNAIIAEEKGRSFGRNLVFSLVFSPFLGYLYILAIPFKHKESDQLAGTIDKKNVKAWLRAQAEE